MVTVETVTMNTAPLLIALISETVLPVVNDLPQSLAHLCAGLNARGHHLQLVRPRQADDQGRHSDERLLLTRGWPLPGLPGWQWGVSMQAKLLRHWQRRRPDVLYIASPGPLGLAALRVGTRLNIPVVSSLTSPADSFPPSHLLAPFNRLLQHYLRWFHNRAQLTLVPTSNQLHALQRNGFAHLQLLTDGVDSLLFHPRQRRQALRSDWGLGEADVAVLCRAPSNDQQLELLQRSWQALNTRYPRRRMRLVVLNADAAMAAQLPDAYLSEATNGVNLASHYASGDVFLLVDDDDRLLLETLASGLGVVAVDQGAAAQHLRHGHNGVLAMSEDPDSFSAAAVWLLEEPETLRRIRLNARQHASRQSWASISQRLETHLCNACQRRP